MWTPHIHPGKICQTLFSIQLHQLRNQFLTDLHNRFVVCLYYNICCCLILFPPLLHQTCNKLYVFVSVKNRSVVAVLDSFENRLRAGGKENNSPVFLHFNYIFLAESDATSLTQYPGRPLILGSTDA